MVRALFRTDSSTEIGTGHVMRCLTLADALRDCGHESSFICRDHPGNAIQTVSGRGYRVHVLPAPGSAPSAEDSASATAHAAWLGVAWEQDARDCATCLKAESPDWLVVDHYALDRRWEQAVTFTGLRILAIDDLADRQHQCDILLDQNLGRTESDYTELVPRTCKVLCGPAFSLLRPEFARHREPSLRRRAEPQLRELLVSLGGVDKDNVTSTVLHALSRNTLPPGCRVTVVLGAQAPWIAQVRRQAAEMQCEVRVLTGVADMASLMSEADLSIGAAGSTSWERCALGLPALIVVLADNQKSIGHALEQAGAAQILTLTRLADQLQRFLDSPELPLHLASMSRAAARITDAMGSGRLVDALTRMERP